MKFKMCKSFYYRIKNEDVYSVFGTSKENVLRNNTNLKMYPGEIVKIKLNNYIVHYVKPMQTIEQIAKIYKVDCEKLLKDNMLINKKLFIGQQIKIFNKE